MKILVFSDSHGKPNKMVNEISGSLPDMIIHLGDGGSDISKIENLFPHIPLHAVKGNCDLSSRLPERKQFFVNGVSILIMHGHRFGVKQGLHYLELEARGCQADIVMYGHTHIPYRSEEYDKLLVLNPGSCGCSRTPSYAELIISDTGEITSRIIHFTN